MKKLLDEKSIERSITRISHEIIEKNKGIDNIVLIGIKTRGIYLAKRIAQQIKNFENKVLNIGELDISLYRDDLQKISEEPTINNSKIDFDIKNKIIILIDDVLYTGRTIRSALDAIIDIDRPKSIQLAVLIDRGHRELPIRPDYVGKNIPTSKDEIIHVNLKEIDDVEDSVTITKK
ncbi:bifunctional pyr operon transcriptional regulator/uracil phosphoribosyltransferase PyrR [Candidatus Arthromitus sp. SFB-rat-Yit]|uniref:bifunctional pyr operon transcriptional regulator/uracil phosphoribosyltransferase PyrR n=1 Tax=Candidatus Arthromitus sp. SFB-rat-Yit TaxID=1041504 RepID=UPI000227A06D|nr:bifunctional pyr operon transcriptional regulator/uracil phosphoribosyltransferase PyrR [Candidatus Arthromitus sp. SFB-rat-Yit]BAK81208.1 uracil phosphoribosyltransferase [Candidatus Arthromitus sp. SFB-rat-Yit]